MAQDRLDWTVAPTLGWAVVALGAALVALDGNLGAVLGRLADRGVGEAPDPEAAGVGPGFLARDEGPDETPPLPPRVAGVGTGGAAPATAAVKTPIDDVCVEPAGGGCARWAMDGFYAALAATDGGQAKAPVRVAWYGDSVSATDQVPGRVRARLQDVHGDGGAGFVHAALPHRFMENGAIQRTNTGSWLAYGVSTVPIADDLYGLGGSTAEATGPGNRVRLRPHTPSGKVAHYDVYYLAQPHGGTAEVVVDGAVAATLDTAADAKAARFERIDVADGAHTFELRVTAGRVRLFGVALERDQGAVVDNLALVSASAQTLLHIQLDHWKAQLAHRAPDLVVIMLGSNESKWLVPGRKAMADYQAVFERLLAPIRAARPEASCLVVAPLDQAEVVAGALAPRSLIPAMVDTQRRAAQAQGCAFWDAFAWMGGKGSAIRWNRRGLLSEDFHHLSARGSAMIADGLVDALLAGYGGFRSR